MPDIRYVCLSDLHFGAENSILSHLKDDHVTVDPAKASSVLDALVAVLKTLIDGNEDQTRKPTLILNGDILELALASDNVALMVFELFLDRIFPSGAEPLFDPTVLYQPGNHDHHLWETARERQYANLLDTLEPDDVLPVPWHGTSLYYLEDSRPVHSELLEELAKRRPHDQAITFRVSYPNLGLRSKDQKTSVVFHHGHNVESIYHLMTTLKDFVFPGRPPATEVWDIEAENFAWIDFFWSTLGRSGDVGEQVGLVYDMLQDDHAIQRLAGNLADGIATRVARRGVLMKCRWLLKAVLHKVLSFVASKVAASERRIPKVPLSEKSRIGMLAYLSGPLTLQLAAEAPNKDRRLPEHVKFIFGHTHKPFVESTQLDRGLANPVRIFNSGGWVVDTKEVEPFHGANLVLLDDDLEVACIRLFNQATDAAQYRVRLDDGLPAEQGPFYQHLSELVRPDDDVWKNFSQAVAALVTERANSLTDIIDHAFDTRTTAS
ncbi:MAG: hypothetical protein QOF30_3359 [Acidimicrobiaceae bacterium]|jgi:UDP-2,3-diacylglucosamine pyrophosphatase LpxH|nr:hypothetical protein [Acidimicrobiaceae bacterium]